MQIEVTKSSLQEIQVPKDENDGSEYVAEDDKLLYIKLRVKANELAKRLEILKEKEARLAVLKREKVRLQRLTSSNNSNNRVPFHQK